MTLRYNANLVSEGAIKDSEGNKITTTYAKSSSLATVATSGSYTDLTDTPTIPAAQVQANWNETDTSSNAYIQNKPNIPSGVIVDQTYDGTSANAQSGVAIEGELANYALSSSIPADTSDLTNGAGFITGINSSDVTTALGYTPANTTLSNLGATSSTNFDGQWVQSILVISTATSTGSRTHDLTSYLPADATTYKYEVMFSVEVRTATNDSQCDVGTTASPADNEQNCFRMIARVSSNSKFSYIIGILPIENATVYSQITRGAANTGCGILALGYRRIGTNS